MTLDQRAVFPEGGPKLLGPYSPGLVSGGFVFVTGQVGFTPDGQLGDTIEAQTRQTIENVGAILKASGCDYKNAVKVSVFLTKSEYFKPFNEIYTQYFSEPYPARTTTLSALVVPTLMVEIDVIARLPA